MKACFNNRLVFCESKYSLFDFAILLMFLLNFSCSKDEIIPDKLKLPQSYYFLKSEFIGPVHAYDSLGNENDDISIFDASQNSYLFQDGWRYPYEIIEIKEDSSIFFYWTRQEYVNKDFGLLMVKGDTLYFTNNHEETFVGFFEDQILKVPAYGYRMERNSTALLSTEIGYVDFQRLLNRMRKNSYETLFLQKFYLTYESR